jgi:hypothetical protein
MVEENETGDKDETPVHNMIHVTKIMSETAWRTAEGEARMKAGTCCFGAGGSFTYSTVHEPAAVRWGAFAAAAVPRV